jgi:isopentenyl diphosphate isomerase/L-lactate dehydrogenase-like FMN-dependent dehydrogenase
VNLDHLYNIAEMREHARRRLPRGIFEYVDRGAEDEVAVAENREAFRRIKLKTRFLVDLSTRDMGVNLFGHRWNMPLAISPTGITGLCWYQGEVALARAAREAGIPFTLATNSITALETVMREAAGGRLWFQLYMWKDQEASFGLVKRARDAGFEALVVTIDAALGNNREYNKRNAFSIPFTLTPRVVWEMVSHPRWFAGTLCRYLATTGMPTHENFPAQYRARITKGTTPKLRHVAMTWNDIARLREVWPGTLIVKGVLRAEDAIKAVEHGADGVIVSNHGGRALDSAIATIDILPEIVAAVGGRTTILLDSGIRRGSDMVKALALGADAVMTGRATLYGTSVAGQAGAEKALSILYTEFEKVMAYCGCRNPDEVGPDILATSSLPQMARAMPAKVAE